MQFKTRGLSLYVLEYRMGSFTSKYNVQSLLYTIKLKSISLLNDTLVYKNG